MRLLSIAVTSFIWIASSCAQSASNNTTYADPLEIIRQRKDLSLLSGILDGHIELANQFAHFNDITVLAPNNDAILTFQRTSGSLFADLSNRLAIESLIRYHILQGTYYANTTDLTFVKTFLSPTQYTNVTGGQTVGVSSLYGVPTFISGEGSISAQVADTLYFRGGVMHIMNKVLTVPVDVSTTAFSLNLTSTSGALNFSKSTAALSQKWDVTIFAPSNEAFQAISSTTANMTVEDVKNLMDYHVVYDRVMNSSTFSTSVISRPQNRSLAMTVNYDGSVFVNNARVIKSDILLSNGILHVIDNVMNPSNTTSVPFGLTRGVVAFANARNNGSLPFANVPLPNDDQPETPFFPEPTPSNDTTKKSLSTGVIIGIAVGILLLVAAVLCAVFFFLKRRKRSIRRFPMPPGSSSISQPGIKLQGVNEHSAEDLLQKDLPARPPASKQAYREELPSEGGRTEKVELPADVPASTRLRSETPSTLASSVRPQWDKPPVYTTEGSSSQYPKTPELAGHPVDESYWTSSADEDVKRRIVRLLGSQNQH